MNASFLRLSPDIELLGNLAGTKSVSKAMTSTGQQLLRLFWEIQKTNFRVHKPNHVLLRDPTLKMIDRLLSGSKILMPPRARYSCICEATPAQIEVLGIPKLILFEHFLCLNSLLNILPLSSKEHNFRHLRPGEYGEIAGVPCKVLRILSKEEFEEEVLSLELMHTYKKVYA